MICNIRLATTEAKLATGYLIWNWRLPTPSLPVYADHSEKVGTSDGGEAVRGFRSFSLTFDTLDHLQRRTLRRVAEEALDSADGKLYATVDRGWGGGGPIDDWIDVSGQVHLPTITPIGNSNGLASGSVTLVVGNLTIEADPANF